MISATCNVLFSASAAQPTKDSENGTAALALILAHSILVKTPAKHVSIFVNVPALPFVRKPAT